MMFGVLNPEKIWHQ